MVNIFDFYDYQKYLRAFYEKRKSADQNFSYRFIQQHVGIDPGYLLKVFQGKKELTDRFVPKFIALLKLGKRESEYFLLMLKFGRSKKNSEIKRYFEQMLAFVDLSSNKVDVDKYEFYQKWYYTAVRESVGIIHFKEDYEELGRMVDPPIRPAEAKKAIDLLARLDFIRKNSEGFYEVTSRFISTGEEWRSIAIRTFQRETLGLAQEALDRFPKEERDISTVTVSLSADGLAKARECLARCRKEMMEIAHKDLDVSRSYHVNFSLFPITKSAPEVRP
jgi:uncharacterized protein (TIGR02147 family)